MDKNYESWSLEDIQAEIMNVRLIDLKREYELCMILSEKAKLSYDVYALAFAYTFIGDFYLASKNKDCIRYLERARKLCDSTEYTELLARIYKFYGMYYNSNYEEIKALEAYLKSLDAAEKCQNLTLMSSAYNNIAISIWRITAVDLQQLWSYTGLRKDRYPWKKKMSRLNGS